VISAKTKENLNTYKQHFSEKGWVSIPDFLQEDFAEQCLTAITHQSEWQLATMVNGKAFMATVKEFLQQPQQVRSSFIAGIQSYAATDNFQYFYDFIRLIGHEASTNPNLQELKSALSGPVKDALAEITSRPDTVNIDSQLTRYAAGHFLKTHCDTGHYKDDKRHSAYVMGFTKNWSPDWGGTLQLLDREKSVVETLTPQFNTLNMFRIPVDHFVSPVANFCPSSRLSATGWLWAK
jgi:SM-20-related protein